MEKLFIHLFTNYLERYQDSEGAFKKIGEILETPEEVLYEKLKAAFEQAHRIRIFKKYDISLKLDSIGSKIDTSELPDDVINELMELVIDPKLLKKHMTEVIKKHRIT